MDPPMPQPEYTLNMINFPDNFRSKNVISHFHTRSLNINLFIQNIYEINLHDPRIVD